MIDHRNALLEDVAETARTFVIRTIAADTAFTDPELDALDDLIGALQRLPPPADA